VDVKSMAVLYTNVTHLVARQGSGITRVADLKGKVVATGAPGSGTEIIADRLLRAAGLDPRADITRHALGASEGAGALKDGKVDALFWSGGLPTPAIQDLAATPVCRSTLFAGRRAPTLWTPMSQSVSRGHAARLHLSRPATAFRLLVANVLVVSGRQADLVERLTRTMFDAVATGGAHSEAPPFGRHRPDAAPAPFPWEPAVFESRAGKTRLRPHR
jgi:hypothetical protein